jgi:putative endonuclease
MKYYLYILTNYTNKVLYLGVTNNLKRRILEHKNAVNEGFTKKYKCKKLVWFEEFSDIKFAIEKEKKMKKWKRKYKENLINDMNPGWDDLYLQL